MLTKLKVRIKLCGHPDEIGFRIDNSSALPEKPARFEILADENVTNSAWEEWEWYAIKNVNRDEVKMAANEKTPRIYLVCAEIFRRYLKIRNNINPMINPCHREWKIVQPKALIIFSGMNVARFFIDYLFQFYQLMLSNPPVHQGSFDDYQEPA